MSDTSIETKNIISANKTKVAEVTNANVVLFFDDDALPVGDIVAKISTKTKSVNGTEIDTPSQGFYARKTAGGFDCFPSKFFHFRNYTGKVFVYHEFAGTIPVTIAIWKD